MDLRVYERDNETLREFGKDSSPIPAVQIVRNSPH